MPMWDSKADMKTQMNTVIIVGVEYVRRAD